MDADHSFDMTTASRPSSAAASTAMAEMMPVTGTWPLRNPSSRERSSCGSISRSARRMGSPVTAAGRSMASKRSPGRLTMNSAGSARSRIISTVTIESMPPPKGTRGRPGPAAGAAGPRRGGRAAGPGRALDAQAGQVQAVAVAELGQAVQIERAQERPLGAGDRGVAQVDDRRGGRLVVGHPGQQVHQPRGLRHGLAVPAAGFAWHGDLLGETAVADGVAAGQQPAGRIDLVPVVPERRGVHVSSLGFSRATAAIRPHGRAARSLKNNSGPWLFMPRLSGTRLAVLSPLP